MRKINVTELRRRKACKMVCDQLKRVFGEDIEPTYENFLRAEKMGVDTYGLWSHIGLGDYIHTIYMIDIEMEVWCNVMENEAFKRSKTRIKPIQWAERNAFVSWYVWTFYAQNLLPEE